MQNAGSSERLKIAKNKILRSSARMFLMQGYEAATLKEIAQDAEINIGVLMRIFFNKENILAALVSFAYDMQITKTESFFSEKNEDKLFLFVANRVLLLYIGEINENLRELYSMAYTLEPTTEIICNAVTAKTQEIFKNCVKQSEAKEFYELALAFGGMTRSYILAKCNIYFTIDRKAKRYVDILLSLYGVAKDVGEGIKRELFQYDLAQIAKDTVDNMLEGLDKIN